MIFGQGRRRHVSLLAVVRVAAFACAPASLQAVEQSVPPPGAGTSIHDPPQRLASPFASMPQTSETEALPKLIEPAWSEAPRYSASFYRPEEYLDWTPQLLPDGLIYRSYLAGPKESRLGQSVDRIEHYGWVWDLTLGGRVGVFRYGTSDPVRPQGFQIDLEGAGMPRLDMEHQQDLIAADFRGGVPLTYGIGNWQTKFAYYHISSHLGDEYMIRNPGFRRVNYVRDEFVLGQSYFVTPDLRIYGEAGYAFYTDVAEPWEFQFGAEYAPLVFNGLRGAAFAAVNFQSREELDFSGNFVVQAGWMWRGYGRGQLFRLGLQYYNGKSSQYQFYDQFENRLGMGMWYDY